MIPIKWDKIDWFKNATGEKMVRHSVSRSSYTKIECSMDDTLIQKELPKDFWQPVFLFEKSNARIINIGDELIILIGLGCPNDPAGNLLLYRLKTDVKRFISEPNTPDAEHLKEILKLLTLLFERLKIRLENDIFELLKKN